MAIDTPPGGNGRYTLGRLTEAVDRLNRDVERIITVLEDLSTRLSAVEKHIENYPGRFVMSEGPIIRHLTDTDSWITALRAKSSVITMGLLGAWTIAQAAAAYVIAQWITHTFDLTMIHK